MRDATLRQGRGTKDAAFVACRPGYHTDVGNSFLLYPEMCVKKGLKDWEERDANEKVARNPHERRGVLPGWSVRASLRCDP
jgi:hypothetical protein